MSTWSPRCLPNRRNDQAGGGRWLRGQYRTHQYRTHQYRAHQYRAHQYRAHQYRAREEAAPPSLPRWAEVSTCFGCLKISMNGKETVRLREIRQMIIQYERGYISISDRM
jgi:hypothetical protein